MHKFFNFIVLLTFQFLNVLPLYGEEPQDINTQLNASIILDQDYLPSSIAGEISLDLDFDKNSICFYLPYNDPEYGNTKINILKTSIGSKGEPPQFYFGGKTEIEIKNRSYKIEYLSDRIVKISRNSLRSNLEIKFKSHIPRLSKSDKNQWFFDGFFPKLMKGCQIEINEKIYETHLDKPSNFSGEIKFPENWNIAAPELTGFENRTNIYKFEKFKAKSLVFSLLNGSKQFQFNHENLTIRLFYTSDNFLELIPTIKNTITTTKKWLGRYPYNTLTIIESSEFQSDNLPGIVALNKPRQESFDSLQTNYFNLRHWSITTHIISQWLRSTIFENEVKDSWFLQGLTEFLIYKSISNQAEINDFFRETENKFKLFSIDYRHMQDILATFMSSSNPIEIATDDGFNTIKNFDEQSPILYIRNAIAFRHISSDLSESKFIQLINQFYNEFKFKHMSPADFINFIFQKNDVLNPIEKRDVVYQFKEWWTKSDWPDFAISEVSVEPLNSGKKLVTVKTEQKSNLFLPIKVKITSENGTEEISTAIRSDKESKPYWISTSVIDGNLKSVLIDPNFDTFDSDRFNNTTDSPKIRFFPGNATTISEMDYTTFWFPYIFRKLGEPVSIAVSGVIFKHIKQGLFFQLAGTIEKELGSFSILHKNEIPSLALKVNQSFSQDYYGSREALASFERGRIFEVGPSVGVALNLRFRQTVGQESTKHGTYSTVFKLEPNSRNKRCSYGIKHEFEHAPESLSTEFEYKKSQGKITFGCNFTQRTGMQLGLYGGEVLGSENVPELAMIRINSSDGANVAIDDPNLKPVLKAGSAFANLNLPFTIPFIRDSFIQSRKLNLNIFYNYGKSIKPELAYYKSSGTSLNFPVGGDLSGSSPLTISNLSLSMIYYTNIDGEISYKPHILFNILGDF